MTYLTYPDLNDLSKDASLKLLREVHNVGTKIYAKAYGEKWMKELLEVIETFQTQTTSKDPPDTEREAAHGPSSQGLIRHLYQAHEKGYLEGLLSYFAEDCVVTFPGGHVFDGKEKVKAFIGEFLSRPFPELTRTPVNFIVGGSRIVCEGTMDGVAATGKPFKAVPFIDVFDTRAGGQILRAAMYLDLPELRAQIGKW